MVFLVRVRKGHVAEMRKSTAGSYLHRPQGQTPGGECLVMLALCNHNLQEQIKPSFSYLKKV